jgi:hypothetical protein
MLMSAFRSIRGQNYGGKSQDRADAVVFSRSMTNVDEHTKILGVNEAQLASNLLEMMSQDAPELSRMQEVVRDIQAERADEFGDWRARVLCCVGFFTLLLVAVIAARWLS